MKRLFRHVLVWAVAVALVASAAAWRPCTGLQLAEAAAARIAQGFESHHAQAAGHDHHAMHGQPAANDPVTPAANDHGCMKCCAMCTVAVALLPATDAAVTFVLSAHVFSRDHETRSGNTVAVDPGIPKRIA